MKNEHKIISARSQGIIASFGELWKFKSLIFIFAFRDIKVKYAQTFIGLGWTLFQPLISLIIYSFFFGFILHWESGSLPYPVYVLSGLLSWNFYSYIIFSGSTSIQEAHTIIRKVYIPKAIFPLSKVCIAFIELLVSLLLFIPLCIYYQIDLSWKMIFVPLILVFNTIIPLTIVFYISALSIKMKDLFHLIPYFVTFGIWFTPVFFSEELIPEGFQFLLFFNPMNTVVNMWRWSLFGSTPFDFSWILTAFIWLLFFLGSLFFFTKKEKEFVDFI
jgi:lipopolysaccharide transport system permease protein